jgi:hypothetical protein
MNGRGYCMRKLFLLAMLSLSVFTVQPAMAQTANAKPDAKQVPAEQMDRDGKRIVGYALMTDSERNGYRAQMYFMKDIADRDAFRAEHRRSMEKRAAEKGVELDE